MIVEYLENDWPDADLAGWTSPGWYFWTESQSTCIGPFKTENEAKEAAQDYGEKL